MLQNRYPGIWGSQRNRLLADEITQQVWAFRDKAKRGHWEILRRVQGCSEDWRLQAVSA